ncbi:ABC transporter permease [Priestia koreensis]|uniref:ABC transporter permease n=1 Tax=Priestia koreensis TaxID=284581 RepID=UPI0030198D54
MFFLLEAFRYVQKRLLATIIIIISLVIMFASFIELISDYSSYKKMVNVTQKLATKKNFYELYTTQNVEMYGKDQALNNYREFMNRLSQEVPIKRMSHYVYHNYQFSIGGKNVLINSLLVEQDIRSYFQMNLSQGRYFQPSEFNQSVWKTRPIILGAQFKEKAKIGDVIRAGKLTFKVVGFLQNNTPFTSPRNGESFDNKVALLDNRVIIPSSKEEQDFLAIDRLYNGLVIETKRPISLEDFQSKVTAITKDKGYSYYVTNPKKTLEQEYQGIESMMMPLILSGILFVFSLLSLMMTATASLYMERKNISIKSALGASAFQISLPYLLEFVLLFSLSLYFSTLYFKWDKSALITMQKEMKDESLSFFGTMQITGQSVVILGALSVFMIFVTYAVLYFNVLKIKTAYMKEGL